MIRVQTSVTVNRPVAEVFRFMSDNQNALQWQSGLLEARITNDVMAIGRTWVDVVQFLGRRIEIASDCKVDPSGTMKREARHPTLPFTPANSEKTLAQRRLPMWDRQRGTCRGIR